MPVSETENRYHGLNRVKRTRFFTIFLLVLLALWLPCAAVAAELSIPPLTAKAGTSVAVPLMIDAIDNLAGIKIVIEYDKKLLTFRKGEKTKETNSLMHVINDRNPGKLIIVMAGARGIGGRNFPILTLTFETAKDLKEEQRARIKIIDAQLMSDQLKDIAHSVKVNPLIIVP